MSHTTSKILCRVDARNVRGILSFPDNFPISCESLNYQVLIELYKNCRTEIRGQFLSSILKDGQLLEGLFLPYNVNIFKEEVQLVMSLVSQVLGLDNDTHINEFILCFLLSIGSNDHESLSVVVLILMSIESKKSIPNWLNFLKSGSSGISHIC